MRKVIIVFALVCVGCSLVYALSFVLRDTGMIVDTTYTLKEGESPPPSSPQVWIPDGFPKETRLIRERHSLDINDVWGRFDLRAPGKIDPQYWIELDKEKADMPSSPHFFMEKKVTWWFGDKNRNNAGYHFYKSRGDEKMFMSFSKDGTHGFFWADW